MALAVVPIKKQAFEIFNFCTKYLVRDKTDQAFSEAWRFPLILTAFHGNPVVNASYNEVTFVYQHRNVAHPPQAVEVVGTFLPLYTTVPLEAVRYDGEVTNLYHVTFNLPIGHGYRYKFIVDGLDIMDAINPQRVTLPNGKTWSFFFTDYYNQSVEFEEWEMNLLQRLVSQIVLFRTAESQNFLSRFYQNLSRDEKELMPIYRLDDSVGEVNYITNILVREERHRMVDYKICLSIIDQVLRQRNRYVDSWNVSNELINDLYLEMGNGNVNGWDYSRYSSPKFFLGIVRRHCIVGAFSHPRHGGNIGCAGWNYLKDRYAIYDDTGKVNGTYFNWPLAMEKPWGTNAHYLG